MESTRNERNTQEMWQSIYSHCDSEDCQESYNSVLQRKMLDLEKEYLETVQEFNNTSEKHSKFGWSENNKNHSNYHNDLVPENDRNYITVAERNRLCSEPAINKININHSNYYTQQSDREKNSQMQPAQLRSPLLHKRSISAHDIKQPALEQGKSFSTQTVDITAVKDIPVTQYYNLTQLKRSNVRSNDELIPQPERINMTEFVIPRPFPAEHPFSSHMSRFAVFPKFNENPDYVDSKEPIPHSPNKITLLDKMKGSTWRHEHQKIEAQSLQQPLKWPGEIFHQVPKTVTPIKLDQSVYYPIPPKSIVPNVESRKNTELEVHPHTANSLRNVERDQWQTQYHRQHSDLLPTKSDQQIDKDNKKAIRRNPDVVRPVEGRLARSLNHIETKNRLQPCSEDNHFLQSSNNFIQDERSRFASVHQYHIYNNKPNHLQQQENNFLSNYQTSRDQITKSPQFDLTSPKIDKKEWQPLMMSLSRNNSDYGSSLNIEHLLQEYDLPRYAQVSPGFSLSLRSRPRSVHFSEDVTVAQGYDNDHIQMSSRSINDNHYFSDSTNVKNLNLGSASYGKENADWKNKPVQRKPALSEWLKLDSKNGVITPRSHILELQQNFNVSEVRRRFHTEFPEETPDLRDNLILGGRKHDFYGLNSQVLRGAKIL